MPVILKQLCFLLHGTQEKYVEHQDLVAVLATWNLYIWLQFNSSLPRPPLYLHTVFLTFFPPITIVFLF